MPSRLKRYQDFGCDHFLTFSCYRRLALFHSEHAKEVFERTLEQVRQWYGFYIFGYVVMPEHVHLLVSEPPKKKLFSAVQMLKHLVSRELPHPADSARFWQPRYYDFNVYRQKKWCEKLRYLHRNPVSRGLVTAPEEWKWSSFRHWLTGEEGTVEIESHWTFQKRERMGMMPRLLKQPFVGERELKRNDVPSHPALSPKAGE